MARTKSARPRYLTNEERLQRKEKQSQQPKDSREFHFFDQLPQDLKEEIFKYIPFYYWATALSNVCKEWRMLLRKIRCPKILEVSKFYYYGYKSDFLINVARSFQITGLDMSEYFMNHNREANVSDVVNSLLSASNELTWVNLIPFSGVDSDLWDLELQTIPASVKNLSLTALDSLKDKDLSNLEYLWVEEVDELDELDTFYFPMLQELHIEEVDSRNNLKQKLVDIKKKVAPKLTKFCLGIRYSRERDVTSEDECIQLEDLAAKLGFQFCCRNLYLMIGKDFELFVRSFVKQGLPYEYYSTSTETLLSRASAKSDIQVFKYLLENHYTTMSYELDKNTQYWCNPTFLLPETRTENSVAIVDYLLQHPEYHPELYPGATNVVSSTANAENVRQLFLNRKFNLKDNSGSLPVIHRVVTAGWSDVLQYQLDGLNQEQILEIISCKDEFGNTPLHRAFHNSSFLIAKYLKELGASFTELNASGQSPLSCAPNPTLFLIEMAPEIPEDFVFKCLQNLDSELLQGLVNKGVDLNSLWLGKPMIWHVTSLYDYTVSGLKSLRNAGLNFNAVDDRNYTLLFHEMAHTSECLTWLVAKMGLDVNHIANDGLSPLTNALELLDDIPKTLQQIDTLIQLGAKVPNIDHKRTWTTMMNFIQAVIGDTTDCVESDMPLLLKLIEAVLQSGIDLNERVEEEDGKPTRLMQFCLLFDFEMSNGNELIELLLKHEGDINAADINGNTLVHLIQTWNFIEILLNHGLNPRAVNSFGETALFYAKEVKLQELYHRYSLDINHISSYGSPLIHHLLTSEKKDDAVLSLLALNPDLSLLDGCGRSAAHLLNHSSKDVAKYVIASVKFHRTPDQRDAIKEAFQQIDKFGHSALYYIVQLGFCRIVKRFVEDFQLEINCPSEDQTPLHLSVSLPLKGGYKIAKFLLSCGANVNAQSLDGNTPLHMACNYKSKDYQKIKQLLLESGASVTIKNKFGVSPVDLDPTLKIAAK